MPRRNLQLVLRLVATQWKTILRQIAQIARPVQAAGLILGLLVLVQVALAAGGNDPTYKWSWGTNAGWINFAPEHGDVSVYGDHLEGYAWGENIGWIRLGTYSGGGSHTYANNAADNYGVNRDDRGHLSGYAGSTLPRPTAG
jgi:hypothetical protein